ncbi:23119_t:CDS:2, partial [Racocetra persica]
KRIVNLDDAIRSITATLCLSPNSQVCNKNKYLNKLRLSFEELNLVLSEDTDEINNIDSSTDSSAKDSASSSTCQGPTILNPHLKGLRFVNQNKYINIQEKLQSKYKERKSYNLIPITQEVSINQDDDYDIFANM